MIYGYARVSSDSQDLASQLADLKALDAGDMVTITADDRLARDTTSDFRDIVLAALGMAAKLEHRRIVARTARDRADAKAKGVKFGRKPKLTPRRMREAMKRRDGDEETLRSIGRSYNVGAATISRLNQ